jgi:thiosulfate dehydrogenase [quinone] large subunit
MSVLRTPAVRQTVTLVAALIGAYLLYLAAHPESTVLTAAISFWVGVALFVAVLAVLLPFYRPGRDETSADEIAPAHEWKVARFLRRAQEAAPFYLGIRLFLGYEWISSAWGKLENPAWMQTGAALQGYWERAVQIPEQGRPPITYPAYRSFIQFMLDNDWHTWFAKLVAVGELLIGLGLLLGGLTAVAAAFGLLMNFSFVYAGTASTNPTLIILGAVIVYGWLVAGWWGLDRFLLPLLGIRPRGDRRAPGQGGRNRPGTERHRCPEHQGDGPAARAAAGSVGPWSPPAMRPAR